jgi:hypothetical protein
MLLALVVCAPGMETLISLRALREEGVLAGQDAD